MYITGYRPILGTLRHMQKKPELVIGYDGQSRPVEAVCSGCGERMPIGGLYLMTTEQVIRWFSIQFGLHLDRKHPPEEPGIVQ